MSTKKPFGLDIAGSGAHAVIHAPHRSRYTASLTSSIEKFITENGRR